MGKKWFDLPSQKALNGGELPPELKADLKLIGLRSYLDPKRFYKRNGKGKNLPEYFHVGTVVSCAADYYSDKNGEKEKSTQIKTVLASEKTTNYLRRKFNQIQQSHRPNKRSIKMQKLHRKIAEKFKKKKKPF